MSDDKRTKFTESTRAIILDAIEQGNYYNVACSIAGVSYKTFREWIKRGRSDDPADAEYRAFRNAVKRAEAEGERKHLACITAAANDTWQAAAWFLERKYPSRWAKREPDRGPSETKVVVEYLDPGPPAHAARRAVGGDPERTPV